MSAQYLCNPTPVDELPAQATPMQPPAEVSSSALANPTPMEPPVSTIQANPTPMQPPAQAVSRPNLQDYPQEDEASQPQPLSNLTKSQKNNMKKRIRKEAAGR